ARAYLHAVAVAQRVFEPLLAVDEDVVGRELAIDAPVDDDVRAVRELDVRVVARGARVVQNGAVVGRAPDGAHALRRERQLPRPPAGVRDVKNSHTRILERERTLPRNSTCKFGG